MRAASHQRKKRRKTGWGRKAGPFHAAIPSDGFHSRAAALGTEPQAQCHPSAESHPHEQEEAEPKAALQADGL